MIKISVLGQGCAAGEGRNIEHLSIGLVSLLQTETLVIGGGFLGWLGAGFSFISSHMLAIFDSVAPGHSLPTGNSLYHG